MSFDCILELSHRYGSNEDYVLDGGGNTSYKDNGIIHVKSSGAALSRVTAAQFVAMNLQLVREIVEREYPPDITTDQKEAEALSSMTAARMPGQEAKRPSIETLLHAIFPYKLVVHLHPAIVNAMTCGIGGKKACLELFGDKAAFVGASLPGPGLARMCNDTLLEHVGKTGICPQIVFLQNHGIFVAADNAEEIDDLIAYVIDKIKNAITEFPDFSDSEYDANAVSVITPVLNKLYSDDKPVVMFNTNKEIATFVSGYEAFKPLISAFTPDQIVFSRGEPLFVESNEDLSVAFSEYIKRKGVKPKIVAVQSLGFFALGNNAKETERALKSFLDAVKIAVYSKSFGGPSPLPREFEPILLQWGSA
jgi:rhamnose utilization protein RhaD (predicted bifunctional aldolase and dehydrogenase)